MESVQTSYGVSFFRKTATLYCRITVNGQRAEFSLQKVVEKSILRLARSRKPSANPEAESLRLFLKQVKAKISRHYDELKLKEQPITAEGLKLQYLGVVKNTNSLCELFHYHNENCGLKKGTLKNYVTTFTYVRNYLKSIRRTDMLLPELGYSFLLELSGYIARHPIDPLKPPTNNGIMKHMERMRKVGGFAVKLGWINNHPFRQYQLKFEKTQRSYLSEQELKALEGLAFVDPMLTLVHDLFIFSCYASPHYSDTIHLKREEIIEGIDHTPWIRMQRDKNTEPVLIPLLPEAITLMQAYKDDPRAVSRGTVFPYVSNKTVNDKLKIIGEIAGHSRPLRFKDARHTFATTVTLTNGMPIESLSKMMGHTKISTTQIYADIVAAKLSEDANNLRARLAHKNKQPVPQLQYTPIYQATQ